MAKILIISFYFPPFNNIGAIRVGKIAEHLSLLGHDVRIITADNQDFPATLPCNLPQSHILRTKWLDFNAIIAKLIGNQQKLVAEIYHQGTQKKSLRRRIISFFAGLYRFIFYTPDAQIGWYSFALTAGRGLLTNFQADVIFASASPYTSLLIAKKLAAEYNIPWVADLRDLWADNHYKIGGFFTRWLEKNTLQSAKAISTVSEPLAQILQKKYRQPIILMQNGIDFEEMTQTQAFKFPENLIHIVYTGILYGDKRDPSPLFAAIKESPILKERVRVHFYGKNLQLAVQLARAFELQFVVHTYNEVSRLEAISVQKGANFVLLLTWNDASNVGVLTGKLFEYIGSGTQILAIGFKDNAAKIVEENNLGFASNDCQEIRNFLEDKLAKNQYHQKNSSQIIAQFDRKNETQKLHDFIIKLD